MKNPFKQIIHFIINGSDKLINNVIFSLTLGFIIGIIIFNYTDHEWEMVKRYLDPGDAIESWDYRKIYYYNYKPAIITFIISSALFFLYYNRSKALNKNDKKK